MLIEGRIHFGRNVDVDQHFYQNGFFFDDWFIAQKGFDSRRDNYYSFFLGYQDGKFADFLSNVPFSNKETYTQIVGELSESKVAIAAYYNKCEGRLTLFRELFGKIPLFYIHVPNLFFAFSSSITSLIQLKEVQPYLEIDHGKIHTYMTMRGDDYFTNASSTFFSRIKSVLPGHILTVDSHGVSTNQIVQLRPEKWALLTSTHEYYEELRRLFKDSVAFATTNCSLLGSHLSGGLDSSSVSSMMRHLYPDNTIHTFHILSKSKEADERVYAQSVVHHIKSEHHLIDTSNDHLTSLELATRLFGQPDNGLLSPANHHKTLGTIQSIGCDVLLNGFGGDSVIGDGLELISQSFYLKNFDLFQDLLRKRVKYSARQSYYPLWDEYDFKKKYHLLLQHALYRRFSASYDSIPQLLALYRDVAPHLNVSLSYFFENAIKSKLLRMFKKNVKPPGSIIRSDVLGDSGKPEPNFPLSIRGSLSEDYQELIADVFSPYVIKGQEQDFILGNHYSVSNRAPFMDRALLELNMSIPNTVKFGDGIGRAHFREAMKGILTERVRMRGTKATLSSIEGEEMTLKLYDQAQYYLEDARNVWMYVDKPKFLEQVKVAKNDKIPFSQKTHTYKYITRTVSLSVWLEWLNASKL